MTNIHKETGKGKNVVPIHDFTNVSPQLNKLYDRIDTVKIIYI